MKRLLGIPLMACALFASGCIAAAGDSENDGDDAESNESAIMVNGVEMGEHWKRVVECDGAHIDLFDQQGMWYVRQIVVHDPNAANYLRSKFDQARANDPFSPGMSMNDRIRPSGPNEMLMYFFEFSDVQKDFFLSTPVTYGQAIRVDVQKYTWEAQEQPGLFRKHTDMKVRFVRNGWREYHCTDGQSGDPDTCGSTGEGWDEWEIANWVFRGCRAY